MTKLYLGTEAPTQEDTYHYPVIKIVPRPLTVDIQCVFNQIEEITHILFTSKNSVQIFFDYIKEDLLKRKTFVCVGKKTAERLLKRGFIADIIADEETQEGIIQQLKLLNFEEPYFLFPKSSLSRPALHQFFLKSGIRHQVCDLYDTHIQRLEPVPDLSQFTEIIFTSPSTVKGFFNIFSSIPNNVNVIALGPITKNALLCYNAS